MNFFQAWLLTITVETIVMILLFRKRYGLDKIARNVILASSATIPFVWFAFTLIPASWTLQIVLSETFAILAETLIYANVFKGMRLKEAFIASLVCNIASFSFGLLVDFLPYILGEGFWF